MSPDEYICTVALTPELAASWLATSRNPHPRKEKVDIFSSLMQQDRWSIEKGRPIFFRKGVMINGRHRCAAVVASGVTIEVRVDVRFPPGPPGITPP